MPQAGQPRKPGPRRWPMLLACAAILGVAALCFLGGRVYAAIMEQNENQKVFLVYMTAPTEQEALHLARELVRMRLAAGVNMLPAARSVYRWQGTVHEAGECLLLAQVSEAALPQFMERVRALHSYEVPCVVAMPIAAGYQPFLQWIAENSLPHTA